MLTRFSLLVILLGLSATPSPSPVVAVHAKAAQWPFEQVHSLPPAVLSSGHLAQGLSRLRLDLGSRRVQQEALTDLDVAFIERTPRYDYDSLTNQPQPGDSVMFAAHVFNSGSDPTGTFAFEWRLDGAVVQSDRHPSLAPGETAVVSLEWRWQAGPHTVGVALDPEDTVDELSERNNALEDRTDALAIGLWVEQSVFDYVGARQHGLGIGSISWYDWAQRQARTWNQMFADSITPLTPQGVLDRVRLDKLTVVPDGALPSCATNFPAPDDKTIDLQWGFPSELVGIQTGHACGAMNHYFDHPDQMNLEYSLMHEMSHARYLVDLYGFDVSAPARRLATDVGSTADRLELDRDVEAANDFPAPGYFAVEGELVRCEAKSGTSLTGCVRGAEGTRARDHAADALVNLAVVRLQDGFGNLVQGGPTLPFVEGGGHLHVNRYPDDLMVGGRRYYQHSAYAWNRIAGRRPLCGNFNAPCNVGEYLQDLPKHNIVEVRDQSDRPVVGAQVAWYRAKPLDLWYGKTYAEPADGTGLTDGNGRVDLGSGPFTVAGKVIHGHGHSTGVVLLKVSLGTETDHQFVEVTEANEAYWTGNRESAIYIVRARLASGVPGTPGTAAPTPPPTNTPIALCTREELSAPFTGGPRAATSSESYSGLTTVVASGTGQAAGTQLSDAFYIFTDLLGNPVPPRHPTGQDSQVLTINGAPPDAMIEGPVPEYRNDHVYTFNVTAPGGRLDFGVGDTWTADNAGEYVIRILGPCNGSTPSPSTAPSHTPTPTPFPSEVIGIPTPVPTATQRPPIGRFKTYLPRAIRER